MAGAGGSEPEPEPHCRGGGEDEEAGWGRGEHGGWRLAFVAALPALVVEPKDCAHLGCGSHRFCASAARSGPAAHGPRNVAVGLVEA